ncbi:MAG: hypothetical protein ACXVHW_04280 [Methanobacterium sp.]
MEREGWDFENQQFIDFDDEDNEPFSKLTNHTHINQRSLSESAATKRKPEIQNPGEEELNSLENSEEEAIIASSGNTILTNFLRFSKVKIPSNEQLYTYAFCKVFKKMPEVHYEQLEQLSIPFFKSSDESALMDDSICYF